MQTTTRQQRIYYLYLCIVTLFGLIIIVDPSPDNHFYVRGIADISNVWMGIGTLLCVIVALWQKPKFWNLHYYFAIPMLISFQRTIMIIHDPARAKVALPVYLMAWLPLALAEWEEWRVHRANTDAARR